MSNQQRKNSYNLQEHYCIFKKEIKKRHCDNCFNALKSINKTCSCTFMEVYLCEQCEKLRKTKYAITCDIEDIVTIMKNRNKKEMNYEEMEDIDISYKELFGEISTSISILEGIEKVLQKQKEKHYNRSVSKK